MVGLPDFSSHLKFRPFANQPFFDHFKSRFQIPTVLVSLFNQKLEFFWITDKKFVTQITFCEFWIWKTILKKRLVLVCNSNGCNIWMYGIQTHTVIPTGQTEPTRYQCSRGNPNPGTARPVWIPNMPRPGLKWYNMVV